MSEARRRQIAEFYRAYGEDRLDAVLAAFAADAQFVGLARGDVFPNLGYRHGHDAIAGTMRSIRTLYDISAVRPLFVAVDGDSAATLVLATLRQRATGHVVELFLAHFMRFRDGQIVEFREYMDSAAAVQRALGGDFNGSETHYGTAS